MYIFSLCAGTFLWMGISDPIKQIAMLTGVVILLVGPPMSDRLKGRGQTM